MYTWSVAKSLSAITIGMLVDRGHLSLEDPIAKYWPEFEQKGKGKLTVRDLMRHESGLPYWSERLDVEKFLANGYRGDFGKIIQESEQHFYPRSRRLYGGFGIGLIQNELVKRVDPKHRNIAEFFEKEISEPLHAECWILAPSSEKHRIRPYRTIDILRAIIKMIIPYQFGMAEESVALGLDLFFDPLFRETDLFNRQWDPLEFAVSRMWDVISPSGPAYCTATSLAKIFSVLANHGKYGNGLAFFSEETFRKMAHLSDDANKYDMMIHLNTTWTDGGWFFNPSGIFMPIDGEFYGWSGMGDQEAWFNPKSNVSYGMMRTGFSAYMQNDPQSDSFTGQFAAEYKQRYPSTK